MFSSTTNQSKGQSLDGDSLDTTLLDSRVHKWKNSLGLYHQENFPPKNFPINKMGEKFHDRSHILIQDYLGKTSEEFGKIYGETSSPSLFEEILTFFCAQLTHKPSSDPSVLVTKQEVIKDFLFLEYIGYITENSIYRQNQETMAHEISAYLQDLIRKPDFNLFRFTLICASRDCPDWDSVNG